MKNESDNRSYVYAHWRPDTRCYFYVGKGFGDRSKIGKSRNNYHGRIVEKLRRFGMEVQVHIIMGGATDSEAKRIEIETIAVFRALGHPLVNMTIGGEGTVGYRHTEDAKLKVSMANKGRKRSEEAIRKAAEANRGKVVTAEQRAKISIANTGKVRSQETRDKISAAKKGKNLAPEVYAMGAETRRGGTRNEETKLRMSEAQTGRIVSDETRAKLAEIARNMPQEQRDKISKSLTGRKLSPERAEQARTAMLGKKHSADSIAKMVAACRRTQVLCVTNGAVYPSMRAAAAALGVHATAISAVCRGIRPRAGGFFFRYVEE